MGSYIGLEVDEEVLSNFRMNLEPCFIRGAAGDAVPLPFEMPLNIALIRCKGWAVLMLMMRCMMGTVSSWLQGRRYRYSRSGFWLQKRMKESRSWGISTQYENTSSVWRSRLFAQTMIILPSETKSQLLSVQRLKRGFEAFGAQLFRQFFRQCRSQRWRVLPTSRRRIGCSVASSGATFRLLYEFRHPHSLQEESPPWNICRKASWHHYIVEC